MKNLEYVLLHVFEFNSSAQFLFAFFLLLLMSCVFVVFHINRDVNNNQKKKCDATDTLKIKNKNYNIKNIVRLFKSGKNLIEIIKSKIEILKKKKLIIEIKNKKEIFLCILKQHKSEAIKKAYQYIIKSYATIIRKNSITGLIVTIFLSIIFLLLINSAWEFFYYDSKLISIDSRLDVGTAMELFVNTVLSILIAMMAWRLDINFKDQDDKQHEKEISSKRKRELSENELTAEFIYTVINDDIKCSVVMKNKNHPTVLPPYLDVVKSKDFEEKHKGSFCAPTAVLMIGENSIELDCNSIEFYTAEICINFKQNENYISESFFLEPICFNSLNKKKSFLVYLNFQIVDNSVKTEDSPIIDIKSVHCIIPSSPLKQRSCQTFSFDCDVVSKLYTDGE